MRKEVFFSRSFFFISNSHAASHAQSVISVAAAREAIGDGGIATQGTGEKENGVCTATRSEYRKVEELTLAGFFVITLLASTISG